MDDDKENGSVCWTCSSSEVDAESFDSIFRINCNKCASRRIEEAKARWNMKIEAILHSCNHCCTSYKLKKPLLPHQCPRKDVFQCRECGQQLYSEEDLRKHTDYLHKVKNKQCEMCGANVVNSVEHVCEQSTIHCDKDMSSGIDTSGKKYFQCNTCGKKCSNKGNLKSHLRMHMGESSRSEKPYHCVFCNKRFLYAGNLAHHLGTYSRKTYPFQCIICDKTYFRMVHLKAHLRIHTGGRFYNCEICKSRFLQASHLKKHLKIHTRQNSPHQCNVCGNSFFRKSNLTNHLRSHLEERPHQCKICGKKFVQANHLKLHFKTHVYKCGVCEKQFSHYDNLKAHLLIHSKENLYKCKFCDRMYLKSYDLKKHLQTSKSCQGTVSLTESCTESTRISGGPLWWPPSETIPPHSETMPLYPLSRKGNLKSPYQCKICDKKFVQANYLKLHFKTHRKESRVYKCNVCGEKFSQYGKLKAHLPTHGRDKPRFILPSGTAVPCGPLPPSETIPPHSETMPLCPQPFSIIPSLAHVQNQPVLLVSPVIYQIFP